MLHESQLLCLESTYPRLELSEIEVNQERSRCLPESAWFVFHDTELYSGHSDLMKPKGPMSRIRARTCVPGTNLCFNSPIRFGGRVSVAEVSRRILLDSALGDPVKRGRNCRTLFHCAVQYTDSGKHRVKSEIAPP